MIDWTLIMTHWSSELMTTELAGRLEAAHASATWLGHRPAEARAIQELESRLGLTLPPSYRAFLQVSDGWGRLDFAIARLRPASEVDWFVRENATWADIVAANNDRVNKAYLTYTDDGIETSMSGKHTKHLIQISDVDDGVMVLNPLIQSSNGEWEAWFFASWIPGARRYASFAHLMLAMYRTMRSVNRVEANFQIPTLPTPEPRDFTHHKPSQVLQRSRAHKASRKGVEWREIVSQLSCDVDNPGQKLVRMMAGKLKGRYFGKRDAGLSQQLSEIFLRSRNAEVRSLCIQAITELAPDGPPPAVLRQAYEDSNVWVMLSAVRSHEYFPQPDAAPLFCRLIGKDIDPSFKGIMFSILGELGDESAIPALKSILFDPAVSCDQTMGFVGVALGRIGPASSEVLNEAASHADSRVRSAAVVGLDLCGDPRAVGVLEQLARDPVESVASLAQFCIRARAIKLKLETGQGGGLA